MKTTIAWVDRAAIGASLVCLAHCLILPGVFLLAPFLASVLAFPEDYHVWALVAALPLSLFAIVTGYRVHGTRLPVILAVLGLVALTIGALWLHSEVWEALVTSVGGVVLIVAHMINWRRTHANNAEHLVG